MTRSELVALIAQRARQSPKAADQAIDALFGSITAALARGERVEIRGFGSWIARQYGARQGRNPRSGKAVAVAPKRLPYFKAGKELSERIMAAWQREQRQPES